MTAEFIFLNDTIRINVPHSLLRVRVCRLFGLVSHRVYVLNLLCGILAFWGSHTMGPRAHNSANSTNSTEADLQWENRERERQPSMIM